MHFKMTVLLLIICAILSQPLLYSQTCDGDRCNDETCKTNNCFSDENCNLYNDCCDDKPHELIKPKNKYECQRLNNNEYIYTISNCDENWWVKEINDKCNINFNEKINMKNLSTRIPVYSSKKNLIYKNIYCGLCNFENFNNLKNFDTNVVVPQSSKNVKNEILINKNIEECFNGKNSCLYDYKLDNQTVKRRNCVKSIDKCPNNTKNTTLIEKCLNYTAYRI